MMVLVRKNELACREHWDGGLWEPKEAAAPTPIMKSPPSTLVAEATVSDHLRQQYTDRVTSVGVAPVTRPSIEPAATSEPIAKREPTIPTSAQPVERAIPVAERPAESASQESMAPNAGLRRESWGSPPPETTPNRPSDEPRPEAPRPSRFAEPSPAAPSRPPLSTDDSFGRSWGAPRAFDEDQIRPVTPRRADLEPRPSQIEPPPPERVRNERSSSTDDISRLLSRPRSNGAPSAQPHGDPDIERFGSRQPTGAPAPSHTPDVPVSGGRRGWTEPFETTDQSSMRATDMQRPARVEREPEARPRVERGQDSHSQEMRQQPESANAVPNPKLASMQQCCGTCRDFRPAEGGDRGWCNNQYAFDHRRMVRRNDLACRSTIGDWWIPNDDWWMQQADYSHHGRPTPIVDDLLRQLLDSRANGTNSRNNGRG
jgi:hypothetical protein